jgi:exodeoxyribonuclease V alpha subunit
VRAGISYALTEAMDEGHCGLPTDELVPLAEKLLEVPQQLIRIALDLELREGTVVAVRVGETPCVFLASLHRAERTIADRLTRLANGPLPWPWIDPDKAMPWVEKRIGFALAESQVAAIRLALISKVLVMTGGPGVGKTTIVKAILRILAAKGTGLLLCAPTGRAAKRMTEATGFEAKTIHRLLEVDPKGGGFRRGEDYPLDCEPAGGRRGLQGRRPADAGADVGRAGQGRSPDRGGHRPASFGRARPGAGRHHRIRRRAGGAAHRGIPAGRTEPHHHQRPLHQPRYHP